MPKTCKNSPMSEDQRIIQKALSETSYFSDWDEKDRTSAMLALEHILRMDTGAAGTFVREVATLFDFVRGNRT